MKSLSYDSFYFLLLIILDVDKQPVPRTTRNSEVEQSDSWTYGRRPSLRPPSTITALCTRIAYLYRLL